MTAEASPTLGARPPRWVAVVLLLAVFAAYAGVVTAGFVPLDDEHFVSCNPMIQAGLTWKGISWAFTTVDQSNWIPLTRLSLMLDAELYGTFATGYHLTNVILHAAAMLVFFLFLWESTGAFWRSALAAGLFGLHPQHVEAVAWVTARKDVLCAFFWMACCLAYARYARGQGRRWYAAALAFFTLGGMAKQMVVSLPLILLALDYWPLCRLQSVGLRRAVAEKLPFVLGSVLLSLRVILAQTGTALVRLEDLPMSARVLNALASYLKYVQQTFWPAGLAPFYPHPGLGIPWWQVVAATAMLAVAWWAAWTWRRRRPWFAVGWAWFFTAQLPVIGIVQTWLQGMADRFVYLPHAGLFVALSWAAAEARERLGLDRRVALAAALAVLAGLGAVTFRQASLWGNPVALFTHAIEVTEGNYIAHIILAGQARVRGDEKTWAYHYTKAAESNPVYIAGVHYRYALELMEAGDLGKVRMEVMQAAALNPSHPKIASLAALWDLTEGRLDEAQGLLERSLRHYGESTYLLASLRELHRAREDRRAGQRAESPAPSARRGEP